MQVVSTLTKSKQINSYSLILENMGLIKKCVSQIKHSTYEFDDLVQEAIAILLPKIESYDPAKGALSTFIWTNIKNTLINSTQDIPEHLYRVSIQIEKAKKNLAENGEEVSEKNIAKCIGVRVPTYQKYVDELKCANHVSLDDCYSEDEESETFGANLADTKYQNPEDSVINNQMKKMLIKTINSLPEIQKQVISLYYNLDNSPNGCLSYRQIGKLLDITHQTAANIVAKGLQTIKSKLAA